MTTEEGDLLEKRDQVRQKPRVKSLAVLEGNNDLFGLKGPDVYLKRLQVIVEVFAALLTQT